MEPVQGTELSWIWDFEWCVSRITMDQTVLDFAEPKMIVWMDTTHATVMVQFSVGRVSGTPGTIAQKVNFLDIRYEVYIDINMLHVDFMMTTAILACDSSPCANDGSCTSMGAFNFTCQCSVGYTGSTCEVNINGHDCVSATCPSNSMCVDGVNSFVCTCSSGFMKVNGSCVSQTNTGQL